MIALPHKHAIIIIWFNLDEIKYIYASQLAHKHWGIFNIFQVLSIK